VKKLEAAGYSIDKSLL